MTVQDSNFSNLQNALQLYGDEFISIYRQKLTQYNIDSSGLLGNTLNYIIKNEEGEYVLSLDIQDYWKYVEEGRKSGRFPPLNEIRRWIKIKPVLPSVRNGRLPSINQLTYLIGRKIAKRGIRGKSIYKDTLDALEMFDILEEAITKDLNVQVDDIFIDFKNN